MSMGIVLHAAWIMIPHESGAPAIDASAATFFDWLCLAIHTFRMQLFFVLAGLFACLLVRKRGLWSFLRNRALRIVVPLVLFWTILCPIMMYQYNAAGIRSGAILTDLSALDLTCDYFANLSFDSTMLMHLWFLYYLAIVYVLFVVARFLVGALDRKEKLSDRMWSTLGNVLASRWSLFVLVAVTAPLLYFMDGVWGIEVGLDTLVPEWLGVASYAIYFGGGWAIYRNIDRLDDFLRGWQWKLAIGLLLTIPYYFAADYAAKHGYTTPDYPELKVQHIRYDSVAGQRAYSELQRRLVDAPRDSVAGLVFTKLPEPTQQFLRVSTIKNDNQLAGLLTTINRTILNDAQLLHDVRDESALLSNTERNGDLADTSVAERNRMVLSQAFSELIYENATSQPRHSAFRACYAITYSLTGWLLIFGFLGLFHHCCSAESGAWRYFSDASYWMYLAHLPIQFQILLWFGDAPWPPIVKFAVYVFGTVAVLIPSYHFISRPTWIGVLLNGRRHSGRRLNSRCDMSDSREATTGTIGHSATPN